MRTGNIKLLPLLIGGGALVLLVGVLLFGRQAGEQADRGGDSPVSEKVSKVSLPKTPYKLELNNGTLFPNDKVSAEVYNLNGNFWVLLSDEESFFYPGMHCFSFLGFPVGENTPPVVDGFVGDKCRFEQTGSVTCKQNGMIGFDTGVPANSQIDSFEIFIGNEEFESGFAFKSTNRYPIGEVAPSITDTSAFATCP